MCQTYDPLEWFCLTYGKVLLEYTQPIQRKIILKCSTGGVNKDSIAKRQESVMFLIYRPFCFRNRWLQLLWTLKEPRFSPKRVCFDRLLGAPAKEA